MISNSLYKLMRSYAARFVRISVNLLIFLCKGRVNCLARLYYFNLANNINIHSSTIYRRIKIGEHTNIDNSVLTGNVSIGRNCKIRGALLTGKISIGSFSSLWGPGIFMTSIVNQIEIGNFCSIARDVLFYEYNHSIDGISTSYLRKNIFDADVRSCIKSKGPIIIKNDVWIGARSIILSGITVGNGAVIGAGSLISSDVPDYAIVGGNPAKIIGYRFDQDTINLILSSEWWLWPIEKILNNRDYFFKKIT